MERYTLLCGDTTPNGRDLLEMQSRAYPLPMRHLHALTYVVRAVARQDAATAFTAAEFAAHLGAYDASRRRSAPCCTFAEATPCDSVDWRASGRSAPIAAKLLDLSCLCLLVEAVHGSADQKYALTSGLTCVLQSNADDFEISKFVAVADLMRGVQVVCTDGRSLLYRISSNLYALKAPAASQDPAGQPTGTSTDPAGMCGSGEGLHQAAASEWLSVQCFIPPPLQPSLQPPEHTVHSLCTCACPPPPMPVPAPMRACAPAHLPTCTPAPTPAPAPACPRVRACACPPAPARLRLPARAPQPRYVAMRCGAMQCDAMRCGALRWDALSCAVLHCAAMRRAALRCYATRCTELC